MATTSDFTNTVPDCLVLKIDEIESFSGKTDMVLYVLYDTKEQNFVLRGKRRETRRHRSEDFSFVCKRLNDLVNFITFIIDKSNLWTYSLYNYSDLPADSNDITFGSLELIDSRDREIAAYDNVAFSKKLLIKNLNMLRNVFNYYN